MELQEYRARLEAHLKNITTELETLAFFNEDTGDWEPSSDKTEQSEADENSEADAAEMLSEQTATVAQLEMTHRNITRALRKIDDGTFGMCEVCGDTITPERLAILPSARTCTQHLDEERTLPL